jgi:hypothetical protein
MYYSLDYKTQVTIILSRRNVPLKQFYYRIPENKLFKFTRLVRNSIAKLLNL